MAYLAFADATGDPLAPSVMPRPAARAAIAPTLSPLEWSVVALAERDRLSSLRAPGRIAIALSTLFGDRTSPGLADPRLEALRHVAVMTWHYGYRVPTSALRAFVSAGFTLDQYELLAKSITVARTRRKGKAAR